VIRESASPRRGELFDRAYAYVLAHGLSGMSLRPLAAATGTSPRVLLFLFGSKDELVGELLARARAEELAGLPEPVAAGDGLHATASATWTWLAAPDHRGLLRLWVESYARSLIDPDGPWAGFAAATVRDWLALLARAQPPAERRTAAGRARRTAALAVLRGSMLDLLATGDERRVSAAVEQALGSLDMGR
jgi:AcrR family transcriptional regulator